jgi:tripartite-type tricarboxylate transporter receptor subunit TctC
MLSFLAAADLAAQQPAADFYRNRTLHMLVGYGSGSGYDVYARVLANQFGRHLDGNPTVVVDNMPGAGGLTMMNNLTNSAVRDGTVIAMSARALFFEPLFGNKLARYDPLKITRIGGMTREIPLCFTWHARGPASLAGAREAEVLVGSTGRAADSYFYPLLLNAMLGTKFRVILGYPDSGSVGIAMERGEIQGMCGLTYGSVKSAHPEWLAENKIDIILQLTFERTPELPSVPSLADFVGDDVTRSTLDAVFGTADMARPLIGPSDIPPERIAALRRAFVETMQDPDFVAEAKRTGLEIAPIAAEKLATELAEIYKTPPAVIQNVIAIRDSQ